MDPITIAALLTGGTSAILKITEAMQSLGQNRATPEQIALLQSLRAENQAKSDSLSEKLSKIGNEQ